MGALNNFTLLRFPLESVGKLDSYRIHKITVRGTARGRASREESSIQPKVAL